MSKQKGHTVDYARSYDSLGRLEAERLPKEMMSYREYDELSRIKKITNGSSIIEYSYSANGNVTSIIHDGKQTDYGYDNIDRLVSSSDEKAFSYDQLGNHTNNGQVHNNLNQLLSDNEYIYTYTVNGNLSTKTNRRTNEVFEYSWDIENKLTGVAIKKNAATIKSINFKYDGLGRRIEKTVQTASKTVTRKFIYDNEDIIMELDGDDAIVAVYLHGPGIDEPIAMLRDVKGNGSFVLYAYSKDHLGSIREMRDQNQKLIQSYNYSAYGRTKVARHDIAGSVEFIENPFTFTAREWQPETGDIYYRARTYNSIMAMFLSEDPIGVFGGPNFFRYADNNPLNNTDPYGFRINDEDGLVSALINDPRYASNPAVMDLIFELQNSKEEIRVSDVTGLEERALGRTLDRLKIDTNSSSSRESRVAVLVVVNKHKTQSAVLSTTYHELIHARNIIRNVPASKTEEMFTRFQEDRVCR